MDLELSIFDPFFAKRPEVSPDKLKQDLERYYLPYAQKLIILKQQISPNQGLVIGVSAIQGAGKTTQGEVLEFLLSSLGHSTDSLSIDDHYITHKELCELRQKDPRFIRRGVTHDILLALRDLKKLQIMEAGRPILISGYDKGVHSGDGDRFCWINPVPKLVVKAQVVTEELVVNKVNQQLKALKLLSASFNGPDLVLLDNMGSDIPIVDYFLPQVLIEFLNAQDGEIRITSDDSGTVVFAGSNEISIRKEELPNGWRVVAKKPDFIFYDGWMLGVRTMEDESIFSSGLPALESAEDQQFAKDINKKLLDYQKLWQLFGFLNVLYVPNYQKSIEWRDQAEEHLRQKGEGMSHEQIVEFVHYFWRSVHPAIHVKNLAHDTDHTDQVVIINDDHTIGEILSPDQVKSKYP